MDSQQVSEDPATFEKVIEKLEEAKIEYKLLKHKPVKTSQEAAEVRGVTLASGAKAMLVKNGATKGIAAAFPFVLAVMSASRRFSWKMLKKVIESKKLNMAQTEEVFKVTGCLSGAVPPFGSVFKVPTLVDNSLISQGDTINFNAGMRTKSVQMKTQDYLDLEKPLVISDFTED